MHLYVKVNNKYTKIHSKHLIFISSWKYDKLVYWHSDCLRLRENRCIIFVQDVDQHANAWSRCLNSCLLTLATATLSIQKMIEQSVKEEVLGSKEGATYFSGIFGGVTLDGGEDMGKNILAKYMCLSSGIHEVQTWLEKERR